MSLRLVSVWKRPPCIGAGLGAAMECFHIPRMTTSSSSAKSLNQFGWFDQTLTSSPIPLVESSGSLRSLFITKLMTLLDGLFCTAYRMLLICPCSAMGCCTVFCDTA